MTTENILYPCINCGILPSSSRNYQLGYLYAQLECANCFARVDDATPFPFNEDCHVKVEIGFLLSQIKVRWNEANHPDKLKERINPCKEHGKGYIYLEENPDFLSQTKDYYMMCRPPRIAQCRVVGYGQTPKEIIEKWNAENPKPE